MNVYIFVSGTFVKKKNLKGILNNKNKGLHK